MRGRVITREQCRGARGMLGLSQSDLAEIAGVSRPVIAAFESGGRPLSLQNERQIKVALEISGVEFLPDGVKLKAQRPKRAKSS